MSLDPMKSVISIGNVDDTSLALPSGHKSRTGQQRVLEQVQTIRRTRSRTPSSNRNGSSSLSPTSPSYDSVFAEAQKSQSSASNGGLFFGNGFSQALSQEKTVKRQLVNNINKGTSVKKSTASIYQSKSGYAPLVSMAVSQANTSRSDSDLLWQRSMTQRSVPPQRLLYNMGTYKTERAGSRFITDTGSHPQLQMHLQPQYQSQLQTHLQPQYQSQLQTHLQPQLQFQPPPPPQPQPQLQPVYTMNGTGQTKLNNQFICNQVNVTKTLQKSPVTESAPKGKDDWSNDYIGGSDITMKEAVEYLSSEDETYQHCGASYIQHNTFIDDKAKEEVLKLNGIQPLVGRLRSSSSQVSETVSAALRNLSFKSNNNKEEIHRSGGITEAAALLRDTDSVEIQKQLTGLLWNLSSVDSLKPDLLKSALPVLMEHVILPYTTGPDRNSSSSQDPEVFFNATGCLRNLSSTKQSNRQAMRKCRGLIDSLVSYVQKCVDAETPDDKSVENCMCVLHNLTFQLEDEVPVLFSRITMLAKSANRGQSQGDTGPIGCFSPQSKSSEHEQHFDFPVVEDPQPSGAGLLIHSKTMQSYLSLLETSQQEETQEACCGALQNLTAHNSIVSSVMSQTIVQKLNGLQVISPLLKSKKVNMQRNAVALVGNLTKNPNLHNAIARKALPELLGILSADTKEGNESDDTLAMACQTSNCLLMKQPEFGKHLLKSKLITSLKELSQNGYLPKTSKAAALLLFNMWSEKDLQSILKKQGRNKSSFVNDITMAAHKSVQVVD